MNVPFTIFLLRHNHDRLGEDTTAHPTERAAKKDLHNRVTTGWTELHCPDGSDCGVEGCDGLPDDPFDLSVDDAISFYFDHRAQTESHTIVPCEVEIPAETVFAAWGQRVREAACRMGDVTLANGHQRAAARQEERA